MSNLDELKAKLMDKACGQFQEQIENSNFEKPPEEETFKENESTAEAVKKQLEYEAEKARISKIAASGSYTVDEAHKPTQKKTSSETSSKTEEKTWNGYAGYAGYGGYGYSSQKTTTTVESSEETLKRKKAKAKAEKIIQSAYDETRETSTASLNIFEMAKESQKEKDIENMKIQRPKEYKQYVAKQTGKINLAKDILGVIQSILEDINMWR